MGFADGAVNGMAVRLVAAGFAPEEAFCLGQVAYVKKGKRRQGVPLAVLKRRAATEEMNAALAKLGQYPMGVEAHRQRIRLWERIFGFGSWHEPVDPAEIYSPKELRAHGHSASSASEAVSPAVTRTTATTDTEDPAEWRFRTAIGSRDKTAEFSEQVVDAIDRVNGILHRQVESAGYIWAPEDGEFFIFTKGSPEKPQWVPGRLLDSYSYGDVLAAGSVSARRR